MVAGTLYQTVMILQLYFSQHRAHQSLYHPRMQLFIIFLTMASSYLIFRKQKMDGKIVEEPGKQKATMKIFLIPALLLILILNFYTYCLYFYLVSIFNIGQGLTILVAFILSIYLLKIKLQKHHKIGGSLVFAGTFIHLLALIILIEGYPIVYQIIYLFIALFLNGYFYCYQHYLFEKYSIHPFLMVGGIGIIGLPLITLQIVIFSLIYSFTESGFFYVGPLDFLKGMIYSPQNFILVLFSIVSVFFYTQCSFRITKYYGGLSNTVMIAAQMPAFWIMRIILSLITNAVFQYFQAWFVFIKIIGFIFIIIGTLIYFQKFKCQGYHVHPELLTEGTQSMGIDGRTPLMPDQP